MAVPLIVDVQPRQGPTGGRTLVTITANNLRLPPDPPETGPTSGVLPQTVEVLFGTEKATNVEVVSKGKLRCLTPANDHGATDVTVTNLDDNGDPIAGETVTRVDIYLYSRPDLTLEDDLTRLVRQVKRLLEQQVIDRVIIDQHTEYDSDTGDALNIVDLAEVPALILIGPDIAENRFFSKNVNEEIDNGDGSFSIVRPPYTVDVQFEVLGISDSKVQMLNMLAATIKWVNRNKYFYLDRDPDDLSKGRVKYELDFFSEDGEPTSKTRVNNSNLKNFSGRILIRGFDIEDEAGVTDDRVIQKAGEITQDPGIDEVTQLQPRTVVIPSPG